MSAESLPSESATIKHEQIAMKHRQSTIDLQVMTNTIIIAPITSPQLKITLQNDIIPDINSLV